MLQHLAERVVERGALLRCVVPASLDLRLVGVREPGPIELLAVAVDEAFEGRVERGIVLEGLLVVVDRLVEAPELLMADRGRRVVVLRELLRIVDELRDAEDDLDEARPVLALGVEPHELREQVAVVGADLQGRRVALRGLRPVPHLLEEDVADLHQQVEALPIVGVLHPLAMGAHDLVPVALICVDLRQRAERVRRLRHEVGRLLEDEDRFLAVARAPRRLTQSVEDASPLTTRDLAAEALVELAIELRRFVGRPGAEGDVRHPLHDLPVVGGECLGVEVGPLCVVVTLELGEGVSAHHAEIARRLRLHLRRAIQEGLGELRRFRPVTGCVGDPGEAVGGRRAGGIQLEGLLVRLPRLRFVFEPLDVELAHLGVELRLRARSFGRFELAREELHRTVRVAASGVEVAQRRSGFRRLRMHVEGSLVAGDGAVVVALVLEHATRTDPELALLLAILFGFGEAVGRVDGRGRVTRLGLQARHQIEALLVLRVDREDPLRHAESALRRTHVLHQDLHGRDQELDLPFVVGARLGVPVETHRQVVESLHLAIEAGEGRVGRLVTRLDLHHALVGTDRPIVIDELLFEDPTHPLEERHPLPRRRHVLALLLEDLEELLVLLGARIDALEPLEGVEVIRVVLESRLVLDLSLLDVVESVFEELGDPHQGRDLRLALLVVRAGISRSLARSFQFFCSV